MSLDVPNLTMHPNVTITSHPVITIFQSEPSGLPTRDLWRISIQLAPGLSAVLSSPQEKKSSKSWCHLPGLNLSQTGRFRFQPNMFTKADLPRGRRALTVANLQ